MKEAIIILSAMAFILSTFAQEGVELKNWKFKTGDNLDWARPGWDDSSWKVIKVGQPWESQGYPGYDGYAWYRVKFSLPSSLKKNTLSDSLLISLGTIDDCDQTFLNGRLLGQNGVLVPADNTSSPLQDLSKLESKWNIVRNYVLSASDPRLRWDRTNVLAIRVHDAGGPGGITSVPENIRLKGLNDCLAFDVGSKILNPEPDGTLGKTIALKKLCDLPDIKGTLVMAITSTDTKQVVAERTWRTDLKERETVFTIHFKDALSQPLKAVYTFTESKTGAKLVHTEFPEPLGKQLGSWTLNTRDAQLTIGATDKGQLCIYDLSSPTAGWNWTAKPSVLTLINKVTVNGKVLDVKWEFKDGITNNTDGQKVTLHFVCVQPAMELTSIWCARPGRGPVRHTMFIKNNTSGPITIYEQETFDVHVIGPKTNACVWYISDDRAVPDQTGIYCDPLTNGYQKTLPVTSLGSDWIPYVVVSNCECGVYLGWEWSNGRIEITADPTSRGARLKVGDGDNFRTDLAAGETFEVPPGFIGAYNGDLDDAGNSVRRYLFNYNLPEILKTNTSYPKVEWNAFAATGKGQGSWDPTEKKYYPFIDDITPLGFEEVVIDIGWWSSYGKPNPGHIVTDAVDWPSGMAAAAKYAHDRGLRFGLYDNETEPLTSEAGKQEFVRNITYLLKDLHADFYRSDCTGGPTIQGKFGVGQHAHYPEDVLYWATRGFYEVIDALYAEFSDFSWEDCQCGGAMKDFGASRRAEKIQNQDRYYPIDARRSFYDSSFAFPPMQLAALVGSWADWQASGSVYEFRSASMGAAYWHPDAPNGGNGGPVWTPKQKEAIKRAVATYKNRLRPLIRNADLYHIFPRPDGMHWDGIEYFDSASNHGVVYIFKPVEGNGDDTMQIKLRGVQADVPYHVTFEDGSNPSVDKTGKELTSGINVHLQGGLGSELMFFEEIKSGTEGDE